MLHAKKPEPMPVFEALAQFFKRPLNSYNTQELKMIHSKILDELASLRDSFLNTYREYIDMMKGNVRLEKEELDQFEEQSTSPDAYIEASTSVLDNEKDMTTFVRGELQTLRKFMQEEKVFTKKFLVEPEPKTQEQPKAMTSKGFYQGSTTNKAVAKNKAPIKSDDSMLLGDE